MAGAEKPQSEQSLQIRYTNFEGNWDAACPYCGKLHRDHQYHIGDHEGTRYIHRMPCEQQKYAIKKRLVAEGIVLRTVLWTYSVAKYIWSKIPFKKEMALLFQLAKNIFTSIRALIYLRRSKPK